MSCIFSWGDEESRGEGGEWAERTDPPSPLGMRCQEENRGEKAFLPLPPHSISHIYLNVWVVYFHGGMRCQEEKGGRKSGATNSPFSFGERCQEEKRVERVSELKGFLLWWGSADLNRSPSLPKARGSTKLPYYPISSGLVSSLDICSLSFGGN